ncbi:hypothetical protein KAT73_00185, partial [candidate division WOR-3 bacterium]|nr:hypothetical protein [candidate division WOR-3 bacterium]
MLNDGLSPISFQRIINVWRTRVKFKIKRGRKEVGMLEKVRGKKMRGIIFPLVLLIGAMVALPLGAIYTPPDRNQNGLPDHIDMMHGIWTINPLPNADFDADGVPDSLEDSNKNGVFEPHIGETDPQCFDTDGDGIIDGAEYKGNHTWLPSPLDPVVTGLPQDADGDGVPNTLDLDSDNDGILDGQYAWVGDASQPGGHWLSYNDPMALGWGGIYRYEVGDVGTDPYNADTDSDGINDGNEVHTYLTNPLLADSDVDGIDDFLEVSYGTNPILPNGTDSDGDGLPDAIEWRLDANLTIGPPDDHDNDGMYNILDLDSDNDGLYDGVAYGASGGAEDNTDIDGDGYPNYLDMDSDGCGLPDGSEQFVFFTDPYDATGDGDNDFVPDEMEYAYRSNPNLNDTDVDGILDGNEWVGGPISSLLACGIPPADYDADSIPNVRDYDSDNDGISDAVELSFTGDYLAAYNPDYDGDGLCDGFEYGNDRNLMAAGIQRPNYTLIDTDGDGISDFDEVVIYNTNPELIDTDGDGISD